MAVTTLSNGNVSLLTNMAKRAGLPWDCVISAELFHHYKPDPETYLGCADLPGQIVCHDTCTRGIERSQQLRLFPINGNHERGQVFTVLAPGAIFLAGAFDPLDAVAVGVNLQPRFFPAPAV